jgi:ABC-type dipeptide/oligopeptide/nickel transport system permease component
MLSYALKRILLTVPVLLAISFVVFFIIELPPNAIDALPDKCKTSALSVRPGCEPPVER